MSKDPQRRHEAKGDAPAIGDRTRESDCPVIVVGIGASAAGLNSFKRLFAKMPSRHGVASVLIQHLDQGYDLPEYRQAALQYGADRFFVKDSLKWGEVAAHVKSILPGMPY